MHRVADFPCACPACPSAPHGAGEPPCRALPGRARQLAALYMLPCSCVLAYLRRTPELPTQPWRQPPAWPTAARTAPHSASRLHQSSGNVAQRPVGRPARARRHNTQRHLGAKAGEGSAAVRRNVRMPQPRAPQRPRTRPARKQARHRKQTRCRPPRRRGAGPRGAHARRAMLAGPRCGGAPARPQAAAPATAVQALQQAPALDRPRRAAPHAGLGVPSRGAGGHGAARARRAQTLVRQV